MKGVKKQKKRKEIVKERDCEDWCFICKDGGDLILCEYRDCLKVYHLVCLKEGDSMVTTREHWTCARHSCIKCQKSSKFHCYCCPNAVCEQCIEAAEFAHVRGNKGLCSDCLELVLLVEEEDLYTDKGKIDLRDRNTYECLFLEYWDIIKEEEGLNLDDVYAADDKLKKGNFPKHSFKSKTIKCKRDIELISSDSDLDDTKDFETIEKRKGTKAVEFTGWGSKPLIEFLKSLGKDTAKELSQYDVHSIICEYIREKKLFDPKKKKRILCDEKLFSVFRRRFMNKNKIYNLLEGHLVENLDQSEEDDNLLEIENCSNNKIEKTLASFKKQRTASPDRTSQKMEAPAVQESPFASMVSENMKLVYLRRSLVEQLLSDPESFEKKVVGSFVRVKIGPKDCTRRKSHQLLQVTGMKQTSTTAETNGQIVLKLFNVPKDVSISMLSDVDFCEEEIDELRQLVEKGLLPKPTVVELEQKAKSLHEDITKDWIQKELIKLQKRIDFANEKGWRRELHEYLEQLELLKKPSEQERLIKQPFKVIAELVEHKTSLVELIEVASEEYD
ncbi:uncharacterized protein At5g08430 isoform X2 [Ricinus communis]|uniref:uncharacterized protein At5g08430 isoform X2 n=1 Tax=Ricinus communis TaxID=3988 RepID=UPI0007727DD5|nr:uncharacterized protein At5g08430 isoform X2 [Ricinus communis]|eukprot:XP_015571055.1 uncharacterized protein At5g08430 isoform X2 [Ricinus communis]